MTTSSLENLLERMLRNLASHLIAEFSRNRGSMDLFQSSSMFCPFPVKDCKQAVTSKCFTTFTPLYTFPSVKLTTVTEKKNIQEFCADLTSACRKIFRWFSHQPLQRSERLMFQTESSRLEDFGKHFILAKEVLKSSCLSFMSLQPKMLWRD